MNAAFDNLIEVFLHLKCPSLKVTMSVFVLIFGINMFSRYYNLTPKTLANALKNFSVAPTTKDLMAQYIQRLKKTGENSPKFDIVS